MTREEQTNIEIFLLESGFTCEQLYNSLSSWLPADEVCDWLKFFMDIRDIEYPY